MKFNDNDIHEYPKHRAVNDSHVKRLILDAILDACTPEVLEINDDDMDLTWAYGPVVEVRSGAIWDRKGYPDGGSLSPDVSSSSYRKDELVYFQVSMAVPLRNVTDIQRAAVDAASAADKKIRVAELAALKAAKEEELSALEARAAKLREELAQ